MQDISRCLTRNITTTCRITRGNNRVIVDQTGQKKEVNHYYPFGGTFASADGNVQAYKYNGKELDTKKG